jgi:hypothetical protein
VYFNIAQSGVEFPICGMLQLNWKFVVAGHRAEFKIMSRWAEKRREKIK